MSTPVAVQMIVSRFRWWGCSPGNYIGKGNDETDRRKESDNVMMSDKSSRDRVGG